MLADKIEYYEATGEMLNNTPAQYKKEYPWLKEVRKQHDGIKKLKEGRKMLEMDARAKAIGIITGGRVQALEEAGLMIVDKQEIDRLKEKLNAVLQDFYQYVQGGKEICAFCLHDYECEPGETICGATYKGFKWRGLNEREDL